MTIAKRLGLRRCAICKRPKRSTVLIHIYPAPPNPLNFTERDEPWCVACAKKVLARMGDNEYVWRNASTGWPT